MFNRVTFGFIVKHTDDAKQWGEQFLRELGCKILRVKDVAFSNGNECYIIVVKCKRKLFEEIKVQNDWQEYVDPETGIVFL